MSTTKPKPYDLPAGKVYRAKVTGRHAITLPAGLCRELGIEVGDSVELQQKGDRALLRKARNGEERNIPPARGILREEFRDWNDIQQFVAEERAAWGDDLATDDHTRASVDD